MACWDPFNVPWEPFEDTRDEEGDEPTAEELEVELTGREGMERAALGLEE